MVEQDKRYTGQLYGGDCYIIHYVYLLSGKEQHIIYYWIVSRSTVCAYSRQQFHLLSFSSHWGWTCNESSSLQSIMCFLPIDVKHFQIFSTGLPGLFEPSNWFSSIDLQIHSSSQNGILFPSVPFICAYSTSEKATQDLESNVIKI